MRFYVAAKTHDYLRARALMRKICDSGYQVTYDWTVEVEKAGPDHQNEIAKDEAFLLRCAENDVYGVKRATHFVAISHEKVCGTLIETGIAIARGISVSIIGNKMPDSVFWRLPEVTVYPTEGAFLAELNKPWSMED